MSFSAPQSDPALVASLLEARLRSDKATALPLHLNAGEPRLADASEPDGHWEAEVSTRDNIHALALGETEDDCRAAAKMFAAAPKLLAAALLAAPLLDSMLNGSAFIEPDDIDKALTAIVAAIALAK